MVIDDRTLIWNGTGWTRVDGPAPPLNASIVDTASGPLIAEASSTVYVFRDGRWTTTPVNPAGVTQSLRDVVAVGDVVVAQVLDSGSTKLQIIP